LDAACLWMRGVFIGDDFCARTVIFYRRPKY